MKKEFAELFDRKKELFEQFAADRKAFTEKWKDVTGDEYGMPEDGMCGGAHPHGHHGGPHGHGRGPGFGW